jgi:hypothetical protein
MGKVVGSRVAQSRLRPWPCTGTPSTSLKLHESYSSYINPGSARKNRLKTAEPLAPRVAQEGGGGGVLGSGGVGTPMGPPPPIPLWPQGYAPQWGQATYGAPRLAPTTPRLGVRPWPCTGTPSRSKRVSSVSRGPQGHLLRWARRYSPQLHLGDLLRARGDRESLLGLGDVVVIALAPFAF